MKLRVYFLILVVLLISTAVINGDDSIFSERDNYNNLRLGNDYVVIVVNMDENALGRFAIETTGGAPLRSNDDNKPLVYGRPRPWTSYTTIWLNGEYYVFGGETGRRAGKSGKYGKVIRGPLVEDDSIITVTSIEGILNIEQILTFVKSSTTGLYDTVQIKYRIENVSQEPQKVGLRIMLDTMLGENDGAPFRIENDAVTSDRVYYTKELPEFWLAFDSISNPNVTSQGTFTGPGVTSPDKVNLADWGSLADGVWDFDFNPGEDFLRKGEYEIDSAIAMYWVPEYLAPGESRSYITNYGLGGITIVPGLLSLGVTSPAEVTFDQPGKTFPIIAYVENTSEITAKNVRISIDITDKLGIDSRSKVLGDLASGDISQVVWNVKSTGANLPSSVSYTVKVEADNTDSNKVTRQISFVGPPELETNVYIKDDLKVVNGRLKPNPFTIESSIKNTGGSTLYDVSAEMILPPGLILAPKERYQKFPGDIQAGEAIKVLWKTEALRVEGNLPFAINIQGLHGYSELKRFDNLEIPALSPYLYLKLQNTGEVKNGDYITIDIIGENIQDIDFLDAILEYNPDALKPVYISRGTVFLKDNQYLPWNKPDTEERGVIRFNEIIPTDTERGTLASIHFKVLDIEQVEINWGITRFIGNDQELEVILKDYRLK